MTRVRSPTPASSATGATSLHSALFLAFAFLCVLRVALNNRILELFMAYTADGGSIVEKIHPTVWGFGLVALLVLLNFRIELNEWELRVVRAVIMLGALASVFLLVGSMRGRASSLGYLIDTYVLLVAVIALFAFPPAWRRQLGVVLLGYMVASAGLGIFEYAFHVRLMPFSEGEPVFRPTGLTSRPLELGQWCAPAMCIAAGMRWSTTFRLAVAALLLVACVVSGARVATVAAAICAIILLTVSAGGDFDPNRRSRRRLIAFLAIVLIAPVVLGALFAGGALSRFEGTVPDSNAMSRIDVYGILRLLSWNDILLGGDIESVRKLILERYDYSSIESSLLVFVVQFGLIASILFLAALARLGQTIARGAGLPVVLAVASFFAIALSNNSLSSKSSSVFLIVLLGIAFHDETAAPGGP